MLSDLAFPARGNARTSPKQIVAGHGRYEAAKLNACVEVLVIWLEHLTEAQAKAYLLADNKLTDRSCWDDAALAVRLKELTELAIDFERGHRLRAPGN